MHVLLKPNWSNYQTLKSNCTSNFLILVSITACLFVRNLPKYARKIVGLKFYRNGSYIGQLFRTRFFCSSTLFTLRNIHTSGVYIDASYVIIPWMNSWFCNVFLTIFWSRILFTELPLMKVRTIFKASHCWPAANYKDIS